MSDTVFTPDERGTAPDPVTKRPGHRTESIVLADEAEYSLSGKRQDGFQEITSKVNQPFEGEFEVSFRNDDEKRRFRVKKNDRAGTQWQITSNVLTVTHADNQRFREGQWITLSGFPSASTFPAAGKNVALQIIAALDLSFTVALTASNDGPDTEAFTIGQSDVRMQPGEGETIHNSIVADNVDINLGPLRAGRYRLLSPGTTVHDTWYVSDGTTIDMEIEGVVAADVTASVVYIAADSATLQALWVDSGDLVVTNGAGVATKMQVEFYTDEFDDTDVNGKMCFFEKDGDLILKNRTGAAQTCAIESIKVPIARRLTASPSQLPAEHPQA